MVKLPSQEGLEELRLDEVGVFLNPSLQDLVADSEDEGDLVHFLQDLSCQSWRSVLRGGWQSFVNLN